MKNVMIDLETLNTTPDSVVVSIGAVSFDFKEGIQSQFYTAIDIQSSLDVGLTVGGNTIKWWMSQPHEARMAFQDPCSLSLREALKSFAKWMPSGAWLWGNGSDFDNVILSNCYRSVKLPTPWEYWNNRCYRTVKNMYADVPLIREGVHHNALDDAKTQALHLILINKEKRLQL